MISPSLIFAISTFPEPVLIEFLPSPLTSPSVTFPVFVTILTIPKISISTSFLNDEMLSTLKLIPKTYDYEIEKAKRGSK